MSDNYSPRQIDEDLCPHGISEICEGIKDGHPRCRYPDY